ncbi:DUF4192 family protein [Streptomyces sp. NPDC091377]|uniref:DUF4192 domain-containing protein n=1 Tax=Streptomyces sp. NPDC091377 TaxID=3365995 RepID=UPI003825EC95
MTNHGESTGPFDNHDINHRINHARRQGDNGDITAYMGHGSSQQVTLRSPAELADALPYLLGYRPEDSIVLVALHDKNGRGRFGGRARLGIPTNPDDWASVAKQLAHGLITAGERRGARPEQIVAYVCQEPAPGETGQEVRNRLHDLAQHLRVECGNLDVPVIEALCVSDGRFWSYCCETPRCCPPEGTAMGLPGTSVLAAAATYAGLQVRGTLREMRARLQPLESAAALAQEAALDKAGAALVPRLLDNSSRATVAAETLHRAEDVMRRLAEAPGVSGTLLADLRDDELLTHEEAATLILGLQDRTTRDHAAEWMEGDEAAPALRLWRALARRCVGAYTEHAAAPLTLAGWVAWSTGDDLEAREALAMALGADIDYLFARLLHQAISEELDPEAIRRCLRGQRTGRTLTGNTEAAADEGGSASETAGGQGAVIVPAASGGGSAPGDAEAAGHGEARGNGGAAGSGGAPGNGGASRHAGTPHKDEDPRHAGTPGDAPVADHATNSADLTAPVVEPGPSPHPAGPAGPDLSGPSDATSARRRRRPRSVGGATGPSHTARPDGRTAERGARRPPAAASLTRPAATPARVTRPRTFTGGTTPGTRPCTGGAQPGNGGTDAAE